MSLSIDSKERYNPEPRYVEAITNIRLIQDGSGIWEARQGFHCFGDECPSNRRSNDPFADDFDRNYHSGRAITKEKAIEILKREMDQLISIMKI